MENNQPDVINTDEFQNWTTLAVAIDVSCYGISEFLKTEMQKLHNSLKYGPCAGLSLCTQNCSQTAVSLSAWCNSCKVWKAELVKLVKYNKHKQNIEWGNVSSSKWSTDVEEVVKVFAPHWWNNMTPYWEDLSVGLSIILNCKSFTLPKQSCLDVRNVRNTIAHSSPKVTQKNFKRFLNALLNLLNIKEIQGTKSGNIAVRQIEWLKKNKNSVNIQREHELPFQGIIAVFVDLKEFQDDIKYIKHQLEKTTSGKAYHEEKVDNKYFWIFTVSILLLLVLMFIHLNFQKQITSSTSDCFSIKTSFPWEIEIDFQMFLEDHSNFVGRKWLVEDITKMFRQETKGILLTAEMGYGKSALVSHILCSQPESPAYEIRHKVLYYHVCKFDILTTQRVDIFIKQLASNLMEKHPTIGNAIQMDNMAMKFLESKLCTEDPSGCFEFAFIRPLKNIEDFEVQYVVIDALDECDENEYTKFSLSAILSSKMKRLPNWIKFLITSRGQQNLHRSFSFLNIYYLNTTDARNREDIVLFLRSGFRKNVSPTQKLVGGIYPSNKTITQFLQISKNNFLFVMHTLNFWLSSPDYINDDIPDSLNELFERNLQRIFGHSWESFDMARGAFEVLCTTSKALSERNLTEILNVTSSSNKKKFKWLLANKLSHFIRQNRGMYAVNHKAVCDFLIDPINMKHSISKENGHKRFAHYLFSTGSQSKFNEDEIIDLAVHVSESSDTGLTFEFQKHYKGLLTNQSNGKHLIDKFSRERNSYHATKLLLRISPDAVNSLNDENVTSGFLAAAFGNAETLKAIIEEGGDVNFKIKPTPQRLGLTYAALFCKHTAHWGYSLLDIASQNGHLKVVDVILESAKDLVIHRNGIGLTALHLAAEQGHTVIMQRLLRINESLADQHALYLASKNGHSEVVSLLIELGVRDTCLRCDGTAYWLKENVIRAQWVPPLEATDIKNESMFLESRMENITVTLIDDEMFVTCSSALEVAVRHGHYDVTKLLLSKIPNALHCREYGGRTPILTAVKYNRTQIFDYLIDKGGNISDSCLHKMDFENLRMFLNVYEYQQYLEEKCQNGSRVPHLFAMYDRQDMFLNLYRNRTISPTFWNVRDSDNATPLHIAACHKSSMMIHLFHVIFPFISNERTTNGSSAFHSALVCGSSLQLYDLRHYNMTGILATDNDGRNILHYLSKEPYSKHYSANEDEIIVHLFHNATDSIKKHFYGQDFKGNTFLHFAAVNGKYNVLISCNHFFKSDIHIMLLMTNDEGQNVFDIAVDKLPTTGRNINLPINCDFIEIYLPSCDVSPEIILSHQEQFLISLISMKYIYGIEAINITSILRKVINRGNAAVTLFAWGLMKTKQNLQDFVDSLSWSQPNYQITLFFLKNCILSCELPFEKSFLHRVLMNEDNRFWFITAGLKELQVALRKKTAREWDRCYDGQGYNILHRAVIGGNIDIVNFLLNYGMTQTVIYQNDIDIRLQIVYSALLHTPLKTLHKKLELLEFNFWHRSQIVYTEYKFPNNTARFSDIAVLLLNHFGKKQLRKRSICNETSEFLSLIHIASAKGMIKVVKKLVILFNEKILNCTNVHGFTPLFFAKKLEQSHMISYLNSKQAICKRPSSTVDTVFHLVVCSHRIDFKSKHLSPFLNYMVKMAHPYYTKLRGCTLNRNLYYRKARKIIVLLNDIMTMTSSYFNFKFPSVTFCLNCYDGVVAVNKAVKLVYKLFSKFNSMLLLSNLNIKYIPTFCTRSMIKKTNASISNMQIPEIIQLYQNLQENAHIFKPLIPSYKTDAWDYTEHLLKQLQINKLKMQTGYKLDETDFPLKGQKDIFKIIYAQNVN